MYFADNIFLLKIKLNCSQLVGYKTKTKVAYSQAEGRNWNTLVRKYILRNTQSKCTQHNGQGNGGKGVFIHFRIVARHGSLSNDIAPQNTRFHWFLKAHDKRPLFPYLTLHFLWRTLSFFCIHNNLAPPLYKAATYPESRLHSAPLLAIKWAI